jgi:hypothetical protein
MAYALQQEVLLTVDDNVAPDADKLLRGWKGGADLSVLGSSLRAAIFFTKSVEHGRREIDLGLYPSHCDLCWSWSARIRSLGGDERNGEARSLAGAIAQIDAAVAALKEGIAA